MANLNKVMLIGNLTRDPELRHTPSGKTVAELSMAINRVWYNDQNQKQEDTTFVDVTLWGRQAEVAQQYLNKGSSAYIEGRLQLDTWDDKATGQKRSKMRVVGEILQLLGARNSGSSHGGGAAPSSSPRVAEQRPQSPMGASPAAAHDFQEEDDIPF
ncbi:MAG: single-stranded DNA-binding protein [Verrucomicrobia bacterium]|nr:MAG: single-stranded DNA-binding protein [Verrucomicrobiota bacterium]